MAKTSQDVQLLMSAIQAWHVDPKKLAVFEKEFAIFSEEYNVVSLRLHRSHPGLSSLLANIDEQIEMLPVLLISIAETEAPDLSGFKEQCLLIQQTLKKLHCEIAPPVPVPSVATLFPPAARPAVSSSTPLICQLSSEELVVRIHSIQRIFEEKKTSIPSTTCESISKHLKLFMFYYDLANSTKDEQRQKLNFLQIARNNLVFLYLEYGPFFIETLHGRMTSFNTRVNEVINKPMTRDAFLQLLESPMNDLKYDLEVIKATKVLDVLSRSLSTLNFMMGIAKSNADKPQFHREDLVNIQKCLVQVFAVLKQLSPSAVAPHQSVAMRMR